MDKKLIKWQKGDNMPKLKILTIRLPLDLWKELRELQTEGKIKSIQQAAIFGLKRIVRECQRGEKK